MTVSPQLQRACEQAIAMLMEEVKGAKAAVISTEDGFEVAARVENTAQVSRLAAMASSMAALGAIVGEESNLGYCHNLVVQAQEGMIVMSQAKRSDVDLILSVVTGKDAVMGQLIYTTRSAIALLQSA